MRTLILTALVFLCGINAPLAQAVSRQRVIILTDIEADPDDTQSLVRLMLYSNELDIRGIIATTSCWMKSAVNPSSVRRIVDAYARVQPNLLKHDPAFPSAETLYPVIRQGLPVYGMAGVGKGKDSDGSAWIIRELDAKDDRPLWISVWGGSNTLAQALFTLRETRPASELKRLLAKLRVYAISDQDDSGIWIRNTFPDLFYIVSPGDDYACATWMGITAVVAGINNTTISNAWIATHIQQGHGPLGALYPDVAWGMEGDTPAFLGLIPNGLNQPEHPDWGGWGGRYSLYKPDFPKQKRGESGVPFEPETRSIWTNATDEYRPAVAVPYGRPVKTDTAVFVGNQVSLWRWRDDFQNDFAARMDWCTQPFHAANHPPVVVLSHPENITVKSGQGFTLDAFPTTDPDGDSFSFLWFNYPEAGSYKKWLPIPGADNTHSVYLVAPKVEREETVHYILKITDKGMPPLSRYKRVVVTVKP